MRFCSIASGSSGNCIYIGSGTTHILIDAGCSRKKIVEGLHGLALAPDDIDAVFLTHEHSDHIGGLRTLLKTMPLPVYATAGTIEGIRQTGTGTRQKTDTGLSDGNGTESGGRDAVPDTAHWLDDYTVHTVRADEPVTVGDLTIDPLTISHDAAEPVGFRVENGTGTVAVATDMGCFDDYTVKRLSGVNALVLEANHDIRMLQTGPYPWPLKQRILSENGHLSNDACGALLTRLLHDNLGCVMLGHLSERNNLPELAYETVRLEIEMNDTPYHASDFRLMVADRTAPSPVVEVGC